jgi:hypothetical protein
MLAVGPFTPELSVLSLVLARVGASRETLAADAMKMPPPK